MELAHVQQRLGDLSARLVSDRRRQYAALAAALDAMSPLKVLGRGYAVVRREDGTVLRRSADAAPGDRLEVKLGEGSLGCVVDTVHP